MGTCRNLNSTFKAGRTVVSLLLVACVFLLSAACAPKEDSAPAPNPNRPQESKNSLQGEMELVDGRKLDLSDGVQPTVLIFASDFCIVCSEEARSLSAIFANRGGPPKNVRILTILIGAVPEDVEPWTRGHSVSWPTGIDREDSLFRSLCTVTQTPCVITHNPTTDKITARNGAFEIADLEKETGTWTY